MNPLQQLHQAGQAIWLDFLRRGLITGGGLEHMIRESAVTGVTSNPSIFSKAIGGSTDYDAAIREIAEKDGRAALDVFYDLALSDIAMAADTFRPTYEQTKGEHGFVSFELEPRLGHDTAGSITAARDLFERIGKPNVMIKVPGTAEGVPAVEELTAAGVNVNITLLFSVELYEQVARAYVAGLERRLADGEPIDHVASVASFFVSRVDTAVDKQLPEDSPLRSTIAVANAKRAYQRFLSIFSGERWERLAAAGARVQRPLWASTGTKNPAYSDVLYVETLVGRDTVNTMPEATMDAFREHGRVRLDAVLDNVDEAETALRQLPALGIDLDAITAQLVEDGLDAFEADLQKLLATIGRKLDEARATSRRSTASLGASGSLGALASLGALSDAVEARMRTFEDDDVIARIWHKDHTVWKPDPTEIADRLGWLTVMDAMREQLPRLRTFASSVASDGITRAVLLGMGGSSLAPEVLAKTLGSRSIELTVLDSTHPAAIAAVEQTLDLERTLFVVASKSGTTLETLSHFAYFFERVKRGDRFVAITDPGTPLESLAHEHGFREVFINPPDIGGRYSALSLFGLVPAALIGADLDALLDGAEEMAAACHHCVPGPDNPGAWLGAILGEAARAGRDKLTLVLPAKIASLGAWIEQLIAESTGKEGRGIVPIDGEPLSAPGVYGDDRLFVAYGEDPLLGELQDAGHPVVRLDDRGLGAEFFRWEFATAVAGAVLGINAFDQPNVAEAKEATKTILDAGDAPDEALGDVDALLQQVKPGDYVAIQAYLAPSPATHDALQRARIAIRDRTRVATTLGFGPRFLHSTGQLHKGGPNTGVFVQVVDDPRASDASIPGKPFTFGEVIRAQALGDLRSLRAHGRRAVRTTLDALAAKKT